MPINHHHLGEVCLDGNTTIAGYGLSARGCVRGWFGEGPLEGWEVNGGNGEVCYCLAIWLGGTGLFAT